ncbi:asparagine synthase (glutamine-hydrolyzing), partial [Candidatus Falkowbacteria bacterium]|nr:asparagine synthase (glutamine-hydrolyzing) [Candidatus Falkowbacteria bacterium]
MCGIAGVLKFDSENKVQQEDVDKILDTFKYRGPDDRGIFMDSNIGLGHLRLSIIDLSEKGHQPMFYDNDNLVLVFNGEVYNYLELRDELMGLGYKFTSDTDSEVILASYKEWGSECVKKFNGMWAFVIWDKKENKLFASRDRFGIKPFHYFINDNEFVFASEIKGLLAYLGKKPEIDYPFLYNFIDRRIPYENQKTVYKDIKVLAPAHNLVIEDGRVEINRYWDVDLEYVKKKYDYSDPVKTFRDLLIDSVKLRMRSDVPVGVCLSGGVDSSVIAGILTKILGLKIDSFSSIYKEKGYGEGEFIEKAVSKFKTNPSYIYPGVGDFKGIVDKLIHHHDLPVRMPGTYSQWHVMKCAKDKVVVTLDGQGADELTGGYTHYYPFYLASLLKDFKIIKFFKTRGEVKKRLGINFDKDVIKSFLPKKMFKNKERWQDKVLSKEFLAKASQEIEDIPKRFGNKLDQALFETFVSTNLPMLLTFEDRISMAFSLESRVPFLDYRLVEFVFGLSYEWKIKGYTNKYILREAFKDILP